jgi:hypothetical protein
MPARSLLKSVFGVFRSLARILRAFPKTGTPKALRLAQCGVAAAFFCLFLVAPCRAQITNTTDVQSTPIPGAGHDYIHLLNETVNPANGSVSLRINFPVPKSRGVTFPYVLTYDSNGVTYPTGSPSTGTRWATGDSIFSSGGWTYTVPHLSVVKQSVYDRYGA